MPLAPPVGAHVSVAGGLTRCLPRAEQVGAEVVQVFVANPRAWSPAAAPTVDRDTDRAFAESCVGAGLPLFVHAPYLVNFGSPSEVTLRRSAEALRFSLRRAADIGAAGVVLHAGSAVLPARDRPPADAPHDLGTALDQVREHLLPVLDDSPGCPLLIEPTAGGGSALASDAPSLARFLDVLGRDERIGVCLDTCHMHAAGADLSTPRGFERALRAYLAAAGPGRIGLIHVNDSRDGPGSHRDRHASIGAGTIGREAFAALFRVSALRRVPMVVETTDEAQAGDIAVLKQLRAAATGSRRVAPR